MNSTVIAFSKGGEHFSLRKIQKGGQAVVIAMPSETLRKEVRGIV